MATDTAQQISPIEDVYPLSALQENMVSCSQSTAKPGQDVEQVVGDLVEAIEVEAFACAWEKIVQRHAVLRSGFAWAELPRPHQEVRRQITVPLKQIDWRGLPGSEQDQAFGEWLKADRLQGFDLSEPPLVRANLFRFGEARFRFVWTFHHALLDATSFALVLEELFALYEAARKRQELDLPAPPAYRQFVDEMGSGQRVEAEAFWKQLLAGYEGPPRMGNSVEFPELSPTAALCREQTLELSRANTDALRAAAQRHQVTISTLLYAAWGLLLGRYGSVEDVVFGTVQAGRRGPGQRAEKVVGLLINTLPLRVRTPADKPVSEWLREIRSQQSAARAFERTPLLNIIECSSIRKGSPLFETIVNFQEPAWHDRLSCLGGGWSGRRFRVYNQPGYPLWLDAWAGEVLTLRIGYEQQRFDEASISRMLNHLEVILGSLASADFSGKVEELEIMSEVEKRQVVCEWNRTEAVFPEQGCVQDLVARQAAQSPNTVAASSAERQLTYGELNCVANQLGHFLQSLGAGPEQRVAVCMDRSLEMVVAELAILKAGAAYVPLDPSYPEERLKFMIEDSGALAVLTQGTGNEIQAGAGCGVFAIDLERPGDWKDLPDTNPNHQGGPSSLAYLIYTSGSSGRPKGVAVEQGGLLNLIGWHQREYEITSQDRATLLAGPAFDASVWELWPYLAAGASLHIPDDETRLCPAHLLEWLTAQKISLAFLPTPMAEAMLLEDWTPNKTLRAVLAGGESLHRRPGSAFGRALINHYGPTECTVVATAGRVGHDPEAKQAPSIGRPIANIRAYCLDPRLRPLPIGVAGELHLSGAGLARGYWNQPAFSAERFIPNPFGEPGYQRLYKTGDLARWLPDGNLEFVGRLDQQIKIRGQRVELGEIESVLREHPAVKEAVVKADANNAGLRLAAYIVKTEGSSLEAPELKAYLAAKLPLAMRPETLTFLPALPITPNGKVDRAMLQPGDLSPDPDFIAPRNRVEEMVAGAWSEVLDRTPIGVNDNFFELGGHSLQATQVMSRLRNIFQASLPLHYLFDAPTVASLAEKVVAARQQHQVIPVPPQSGRRGEALTASFNQERMWFLEQLEPGLALHNIPFAIQLKGTLDVTALERGLTEILARHQPLRTVFSSVDGRLLLRETPPGSAPLPLVDLSAMEPRERESEAQRIVLENARVPFDLSQGPLFRACLVRLGRQEHLLLLTMHLIASDAWSVGVLYKELAALYEAFSSGRPSPLQPLPISYSDFARWQRQSLRGETLEAQLAYWKAQWPDGDPGISLPTDFPRPEVQTFNGATRFFALPASLAQSLKAISRREDVTLYMLSLAAFKALIRQYSGNDLIAVGSPIAGRTFRNTEDLIGSFVNTLVLRTDLGGDPAFTQLLGRVRATCLGAYHHQDLPVEKLVDALQPSRDASRHPLFQVMFTFQNAPLRPLELAGLDLTPLALDAGIAKFDLTLVLEEAGKGLSGAVEFNTDLFETGTITQLLANFQTLLERIASNPQQRLSALTEGLSAVAKPQIASADTRSSRQPKKKEKTMQTESVHLKPGSVRRKAVRMEGGELVTIKPLLAERPAPILIEATVEGVSLPEWARSHRDRVDQLLMEHRALLFRNFAVKTVEQFQESVLATCNGELLNYVDRSTPRPAVGNKVYVSTIYPSAETIQMHNEGTYWRTWPLKIYFCSLVTAEQGGETPIADVRNVLRRLAPEVRERFEQRQVTYVRNYNDGFGLPWQETFQTRDKAEVEAYCRSNDIEFEWKEGDRLRTRQTRPAVRKHPVTGEMVWFNHAAFFHVTSLAPQVRQELLSAFREEDLPYNTYYGDGAQIEPEVAAAIREAYSQEKIVFPWRNGDVMLLDNMSMAHGRQPYQGKREVVVSMAEPCRAG